MVTCKIRIRASSKGGVESIAGFLGELARFGGLCMYLVSSFCAMILMGRCAAIWYDNMCV